MAYIYHKIKDGTKTKRSKRLARRKTGASKNAGDDGQMLDKRGEEEIMCSFRASSQH